MEPADLPHAVLLFTALTFAWFAGRQLCKIRHYGQFKELTYKGGWAAVWILLAVYFLGRLLIIDAR